MSNASNAEAKSSAIVAQFKCLGDQVRLEILTALLRAARPVSTGDIIAATHYRQPRVWKHLQRLQEVGLVERQGDCYVANAHNLHSIAQTVESIAQT